MVGSYSYLEGVADGQEMRLQEAGQLAAPRRFLRSSSFLRHGDGPCGVSRLGWEDEGGEEEPTGTGGGGGGGTALEGLCAVRAGASGVWTMMN